ncbi:LacI family DNA-binding transcriptional regulator [Catenuloplanes atrovinosus]|uniref:LacI family transcriptional regulator n=1 Tax=Catenuloplanes atrovinosus TaxID=137266 RepID=A0AAE4C976_9ACTN|nr:LacI family DNA-binding transcriptional regulator [Catenuloplanes atrovinosus]MDR7274529.1 LacI family transcriptional regulator [Catenuloplanes atrovinosus]
MATIRELARHCGVSVATVSRVFNTPEVVSRATRQRVEAAAAEIGYLPNESARTLATKKSNMIGLVWDTDHRRSGWRHPFLQEILVALKTALSAHGLHLLLLATGADAPDRHLAAVRRHNLDGVVLIDNGSRDPAVLALADAGIPCVALDLPLTGPCCTYVTSDNAGGARQAVAHLLHRGHRRIATISGPSRPGPGADRLAGFRAELAAHGVPLPPDYVVEGDYYLDSGRAATHRLLRLDTPPTAVFAAGDEMAVGALQAATDAGLRVPGDLAIVGFDDIELAALLPPGLTTIAQDRAGFGTAAAEALISMIQSSPDTAPPPPITLPTRLVPRGTA